MPKAKYQLANFLESMNDDYKDFVNAIHEIMQRYGCKFKIQFTKSYGLHVSYSQPQIKTVNGIIIYLLMHDGKLKIRINAAHHHKYPDVLSSLPEGIINQINHADNCMKSVDPNKCWQGCFGYSFYIGSKHYHKCIVNCFLLDVNSESMPFLVELIKNESSQRGMIQ